MKKFLVSLLLISTLVSLKKSDPKPSPITDDTTKVVLNDSVLCGENSTINFTCKGNSIGAFGSCIKDIDGNVYKTVIIGKQRWMAENLKVSRYNDGTEIPNVKDANQWSNDTIGAWVYYNNDGINNAKYGKLYNWYAVSLTTNGNKNVCPTGWHVPTDAEWTVLTDFLGGDSVAGSKMKEVGTTNWKSPNTDATNSSLFTGLPGDSRQIDGSYNKAIGHFGIWWSSEEEGTFTAWLRYLKNGYGGVRKDNTFKMYGFSVRCLKD